MLALGAQYVVYNYDELSRQHQYRPGSSVSARPSAANCRPRVDIGQIKSSNRRTQPPRVHRSTGGRCDPLQPRPFAQPFPLLEIRFADLNGKPLASRSFKPSEYLSGELAGQTIMPPQVPIHIALDILDPGAKAVNYSLGFHSPD